MRYNCLVVDDNLIDRDLLTRHLEKISNLSVIAVCSDGKGAADVLVKENIDIVFSDIDMPDLSGMGLLRGLKNPPVFVFITSFAEYAVESFNLDVIDFIVKPATFERLFKASAKAVEYLELKRVYNASKVLSNSDQASLAIESQMDKNFIFIREAHGITRLACKDILYIESMGDFSKIYTVQNERHVTLVSLKNFEKQLPASWFMRIHKQFIVNVNHIITITGTNLQLSNKEIIPVSPILKQNVLDRVVGDEVISRFTH